MLRSSPGAGKLSTQPRRTLREILAEDVESKRSASSALNQTRAKKTVARIASENSILRQLQYVRANFIIMGADVSSLDSEIKKLEKLDTDEARCKTPREKYRHYLAKKLYEKKGKDNLKQLLKRSYQQIEAATFDFQNAAVREAWWAAVENICKNKINNTNVETTLLDKPLLAFTAAPTKLEMRDHLSKNMNDYLYVKNKSGGANQPGLYGGEYVSCYTVNGEVLTQRVLIKQDTTKSKVTGDTTIHHGKNITEFVLGRLMNYSIGDSAASITLVRAPWKQDGSPDGVDKASPDESGENTYVLSVFYDEFNELFKELYLDDGKEPPAERPKYLSTWFQKEFTHIFKTHLVSRETDLPNHRSHCRHLDYDQTTVASIFGNDFDAHTANYGVVPVRRQDGHLVYLYETTGKFLTKSGQYAERGDFALDADGLKIPEHKTDASGKLIPLYMKDRAGNLLLDEAKQPRQATLKKLVRIDFGGAMKHHWLFGGMEDDVHMHSHLNHPPLLGPTNHIREQPRLLKVNLRFAAELERQGYRGAYDKKTVSGWIDDIMQQVSSAYGAEPIKNFASRMGLTLGKSNDKKVVVDATTQFLKEKMLARQISLSKTALEIRMSCLTEFENQEIKKNDELTSLIDQNPNYFLRANFHFRHPRQQAKDERITGGAITVKKWEWRWHATSRMKAYAEKQGLGVHFGVLKDDFNAIKDLAWRAEIFIARLKILARFARDEKEKHALLEQAADVQLWLTKYSTDKGNTTTGHLVHVMDAAYRDIRAAYHTMQANPEVKKLMDFKKDHFNLDEKSGQQHYVQTMKQIAQTGHLPWEAKPAAKTSSASTHSGLSYSPPTLFSPHTFDHDNVNNVTLATAVALQSVVASLSQTMLALAALQRELEARYGAAAKPTPSP